MPSQNWVPKNQSLFGKRIVGLERILQLSPGQDEKAVVNGLIMDIYNLFIAQKLAFEKKNMPPLTIDYRFSDKDLLFTYSIQDPSNPDPNANLHIIALAHRPKKNKPMDSVTLVLAPGRPAQSQIGDAVAEILDGLSSPYHKP